MRLLFKLLWHPVRFIARFCFHRDRLKAVRMVPLRATLQYAIEAWGEPQEQRGPDEIGATSYGFVVSLFHVARIVVWNDVIHSITYDSDFAHPKADLLCILKAYAEGNSWSELSPGYSYVRSDRACTIACSAMPMLNVCTTEYWQQQYGAKSA